MMDFRAAGGAARRHAREPRGVSPLAGLLFVSGIGSLAFGAIAGTMADPLMAASLLTTYGAANTMMLLLVDFTGMVLSPDDYGILGPRPIGSRTYFAARLAGITVYVGAISVVIASVPAVVFAVRFAWAALPATLLAVLLGNLSTAVLVINAYVILLRWVHPAKLRRAMAYLQLIAATSFYVVYYLAVSSFEGALAEHFDYATAPWLWLIPTTWFAALVAISIGAAAPVWIAAGGALLVAGACVPLAAGRLSLDYARRIGEMIGVAEPPRASRSGWLPGFASGESRAVALLVRAQFRFDQRFRMGVLGILPLTIFYLLLGVKDGALQDPFVPGTIGGGPGVFMAVVFIPMTLHAALSTSESWRAAWIFFATPASAARVIVAAKNFVALYFLGAYVLVLTAIWTWFFGNIWHALVHALFAGLAAHLLLQLTVMVKPALPFAAEPRKAEHSNRVMWIIALGSLATGILPMLLPLVYRSTVLTWAALALTIGATAVLEYALRLRVNEAIGELEFRH
jgi:hypothetical protein